jgi:tetratricopeptide (TPR) repeat protein
MILVVAILLAAVPAADPGDAKERAARRFDEGLVLVDRGDFAGAVVAFKEAYGLHPHPVVLLNLGQAYIALDRPREAVETLERFLRESGPELTSDRRQAVEDQLRLQRQRLPPAVRQPPAMAPPPLQMSPARDPGTRPARTLTPHVVGGLGVALGIGALTLELYNQGRYHRWEGDRDAWQREPINGEAAQAAHEARRNELNESLHAIKRGDAVVVGLGVGAAVAVGAAALIYWRQSHVVIGSTRELALLWTW